MRAYIHPLTILSILPLLPVLGALLALRLFDTPFSLIALIGIMLLIGIVKKNAIIMVEFCDYGSTRRKTIRSRSDYSKPVYCVSALLL